jgi:hypothetical protein
VKGRLVIAVSQITVRAPAYEELNDLAMAQENGIVKRGIGPDVSGVDECTASDEDSRNGLMPVVGGKVERRLLSLIARVYVRAGSEEKSYDPIVSLSCRQMQRCHPIGISGMHRRWMLSQVGFQL